MKRMKKKKNKFKTGHMINYEDNEFYDLILGTAKDKYALFCVDMFFHPNHYFFSSKEIDTSDYLVTDIFLI